jgi:hypothetical protein
MCRGLPHYNIRGAQSAQFQIAIQNMYMHSVYTHASYKELSTPLSLLHAHSAHTYCLFCKHDNLAYIPDDPN